MQDAQAEFPEVKPTALPQEPQVEKSGEFRKVTAEELDFLHSFTKGEVVLSGHLTQLKNEDPEGGKRYEDINARRQEELRKLAPPEFSRNHQEGYSETEMKRTGGYMQVSFEEMNNRLKQMKDWMVEWDGLSPEQKLVRYNRMEELRRIKNIPIETIPKEQYEANIAHMEKREKNTIQDVETRVKSLDSGEFEYLKHFFDGYPSPEKVAERWSSLERSDIDQYRRLQKIHDRFQKELELKEPPFALEQSRFYDGKPVRIEGTRTREIDQMDLPALQALLERSEAFAERWEKLPDNDRIQQLKRVRQLRGGTLLEGEMEGIKPYLKEGETVEGKGVEFWTSGIKGQIRNLQDAIGVRETQKKQQELEPTRAAIEEVSHDQVIPAPQEAPPPPPTPKGGLLGRIFGKK